MVVKIIYFKGQDGTHVAWIIEGWPKNYKDMAKVLNNLTEEEIELFERHFNF